MAIFGRSNNQSKISVQPVQTSETTVISTGAKIEGNLNLTSKLHIDGEVNGQIFSSNSVSVGKNGVVKADLKAERLIISGVFEGNADCETIEVLNSGNLIGNVIVKDLVIEAGGNFEGQSQRRKTQTAKNQLTDNSKTSIKK